MYAFEYTQPCYNVTCKKKHKNKKKYHNTFKQQFTHWIIEHVDLCVNIYVHMIIPLCFVSTINWFTVTHGTLPANSCPWISSARVWRFRGMLLSSVSQLNSPRKMDECLLKRDHLKRKWIIFQPSIVRGYVSYTNDVAKRKQNNKCLPKMYSHCGSLAVFQ